MSVVLRQTDDQGIATLTVNRPEAMNAINGEVLDAIAAAGAELRGHAKAIIVTGAGKAFVAGADIVQMANMDGAQAAAFSRRGQRAFAALTDFPGPVLAAVNGYALGGGLELALACDIIVASDRAVLGQPEAQLGVVTGFGGSQRLPRRAGPGIAKWLLMSGERVKADEALRLRIVDHVVPHEALLATARDWALRMAANGPLALAAVKRLVDEGLECDLYDGMEFEAEAFGASFRTADQKEGMAAFLAKRKPVFTGR